MFPIKEDKTIFSGFKQRNLSDTVQYLIDKEIQN